MTQDNRDINENKQKRPGGSPARYIVAVLVLLVAIWFAFVQPALADDENTVNPQQLPDSSFIYDTSIIDLGNADSYYNNQTVQVVGEVVGDRVTSEPWSRYCWITLNATEAPSNASVSVYMSQANADKIDTYGKYGKTGTYLQVRGTFHLSCPQHEGITDLHADNVSIAEKGKDVPAELDLKTFIPGAVVVAIGLILMFVYHRLRERMR